MAAAESYTYIVVLHERVTAGEPAEPDVAALGGEVLHRSRNRRVVRVPAEAARVLATHQSVSSMQRVQTEREVPALPRSPMIASNIVASNDSTPPTWSSGDYVYNGDGNITAIGADSYVYDSATRLVSASLTDGATQSEQYTYDSFGNLVHTARTAGPSTSTPASTATNRLTNATYDSAGNVATSESGTTQYIYDGFNMLRFMDTSTTLSGSFYVYTAGDERVGVNEDGEKRWMIRDLSGKVLREWEENGPVWAWREDYVYRNGALIAAERDTAEGGTRHFHLDHLGTARLITDQSSMKISLHDYFPFGVEKTDFRQEMLDRGTHWPSSMKFTGHERDFIGGISTNNRNQLDYMHARYCNPVWGRFLSVDPGGIDLNAPQSWNRYAYVMNDPVNNTDPDGRETNPVTGRSNIYDHQILVSQSNRRKGFFGYVRTNSDGSPKKHGGNDIAAPLGTPIFAPVTGTVVQSGWGGKDGGYVLRIRRANDENGQPVYVHISHLNGKPNVKVGDKVVEGQPNVAEVGNTGNAKREPPHAHTTVFVGGQTGDHAVDPQEWFRNHPSTAPAPPKPPKPPEKKEPCEANKDC